jgi:hypothetical protein
MNVKLMLSVMQMLLAQTSMDHTTVRVKQMLVEMASFVKVNVLRMFEKMCINYLKSSNYFLNTRELPERDSEFGQ